MLRQNFLLISLLFTLNLNAQLFDVEFESMMQIERSSFRIWIPEGANSPIKGIIIRCHGSGGGLLTAANDLQWQALAKKWNMALLGVSFEGDSNNWAFPEKGSYSALTQALSSFATQSGKSELTSVPWALWGHSAGGYWVYFMTRLYSSKIIAAYTRTGNGHNYNLMPDAGLKVPYIIAAGGNEAQTDNRFYEYYVEGKDSFINMRSRSGLTSLSVEPYREHEAWYTRYLCIPFFDAVFPLRLPATGNTLNDVNQNTGWLGNNVTKTIASYNSYSGNKLQASWFPNEKVATLWKSLEDTGVIPDDTKPSKPYDLTGELNGNTLTLKWKADVDIESGIKRFNIYKNGVLFKNLPEINAGTSGADSFQNQGYSDEPIPIDPKMEIDITNVNNNDVFQITQVNLEDLDQNNLESDKSNPFGLSTLSKNEYGDLTPRIQLIPTVFQNELNLSPSIEKGGNYRVDIYNILGIKLLSQTTNNSNSIIEAGGLNNGIYLANIYKDNVLIVKGQKILKQ
jgi:hypothetical protein